MTIQRQNKLAFLKFLGLDQNSIFICNEELLHIDNNLDIVTQSGESYQGRLNELIESKHTITKVTSLTRDEITCVMYWKLVRFAYIARNKDGTLYIYNKKPIKITDQFFLCDDMFGQVAKIPNSKNMFPTVLWSNNEATSLNSFGI